MRTIPISRRANSPRTTPCWSSAWRASRAGWDARSPLPTRRGRSSGSRTRSERDGPDGQAAARWLHARGVRRRPRRQQFRRPHRFCGVEPRRRQGDRARHHPDRHRRQHALAAFVSCQNEYSLLAREVERELIPTAKAFGLGILPYFPLGSGLLTGKYKRGAALPPGSRLAKIPRHAQEFINERNWRMVGELETFAARRGHTMLELAFSWLLREGAVARVIAGATPPEEVEQNVRAAGWTLSAEDLAEIDRITL